MRDPIRVNRPPQGRQSAEQDLPADGRAGSVLIFVHIPRTGGTTLRAILAAQYTQQLVVDGEPRPEDFTDDLELVQGHVNFGIHELVAKPTRYATMLRRPVDRIVSLFHMHLKGVGALVPTPLRDALSAAGDDLRSFALSDAYPELENGQTRRLSGAGVHAKACTREMFEIARENLHEEFALVGLTERFAESVLLMQRELGWSEVQLGRRRHISAERLFERNEDLDARAIEAIVERNQFDLQLYADAQHLFADRVKRLGPSFQEEALALAFEPPDEVRTRLLESNEELSGWVAKYVGQTHALRAKTATLRTKLAKARSKAARLASQNRELRREVERLRARDRR